TAPRHTPVLAARNGVIVGLSEGGNAGLAVLQRDPKERYAFFYAHLEGFAEGLEEGDFVRQGQVIGYVGTSGNAPENVPHLHFAIHQLDSSLSFRRGRPLNPHPLLSP
ncbi:MAG TPA: M23 family metallopeptidase, partial [Acidobacteriota bacterium]|nr:M23 family metallopeptidase [Acidobacteriota bacterium]